MPMKVRAVPQAVWVRASSSTRPRAVKPVESIVPLGTNVVLPTPAAGALPLKVGMVRTLPG